jgi:hypothetical protein
MSKSLLFIGAACALPLLGGPRAGLELAFQPEEGTRLTTTAKRSLKLVLEDSELSMFFDGEEQEAESPDIELTMLETESLVFTDEYSSIEGGRAERIERSFETIETNSTQSVVDPAGEEFEDETPGSSDLVDTGVVFTWDADAGEYDVSFDEDSDDADEELLEELYAVADFSWFLPEGEVEEGDTWEIDIEAFKHTTAISGELAVIREGEEDEPEDDFGEQFEDNLSGEMEGEFKGVREVYERRLAVVHVSAKLATQIEQVEEIEELEGGEGESSEVFEFEFELEGNLLWDIEGGHAHSFEFEGDVNMTLTNEQELAGEGHEISFTQVQEFGGSIEYDVSFD